MKKQQYEVGQTVYFAAIGGLSEGTVESVGRKWIEVLDARSRRFCFDMESGRCTAWWEIHLTTPRAYREACDEARRRLNREHDVTGPGLDRLELSSLRAIEAIIRSAARR